MEQQKSGELFHFSFVVWQQLPAVTRRWGDIDAFTFELYSATGWTCIPPVTPDATNKLFVLKLTSMGLCVAQAENPSKSHPRTTPKSVWPYRIVAECKLVELFLGSTLKINMSPVERWVGISPFFPTLETSGKRTIQQQRC